MHIVFCCPIYRHTEALFTFSLFRLVNHVLTEEVNFNGERVTPKLDMIQSLGARIAKGREAIAEQALAVNPDYLFWLDADHTFPPDALFRLAAHDLPFVGINAPMRTSGEIVPSAANIVDGKRVPVMTTAEKAEGSPEPVDLMGFGVTLVKADVFRALPRPWFVEGPNGSDGYFCEKLKTIGVHPHVDHALSMDCGHIAETVLTFPR